MISIITTIYNEKENIKLFVDSVTKVIEKQDTEYEIILVDNGSTDASLKVIKELCKY